MKNQGIRSFERKFGCWSV